MRNWILPGVLAVALLATGVWGFQENRAKQNLLLSTESFYQRAFHELVDHLDIITGQIAQTLASSTPEQVNLGLATIWRQSFGAQEDLGQLPLTRIRLDKTEIFLSELADYSYALLELNNTDGELSEAHIQNLEGLYLRSKQISNDLKEVESKVTNDGLRWSDVEAVTLEKQVEDIADNTILDGFQMMEMQVEEYPELQYGPDILKTRPKPRQIMGKTISVEEAEAIALKFWEPDGTNESRRAKTIYTGEGDIATYGVEIPPTTSEANSVYIDVSKNGGHVVEATKPRTVDDVRLTMVEAEKKARDYLAKHQFEKMMLISVEDYDNTPIFTLVPQKDGVLIYPEQVKVKVALDNGEILGYEASRYLMYQIKDYPIPKAQKSEQEIRDLMTNRVEIVSVRPAVILNDFEDRVLTYEVRAKLIIEGKETSEEFIIFMNAINGEEEKVLRVTPSKDFNFRIAS